MTVEEAIQHCLEVAERYDRVEDSNADDRLKQECIQCAADHRQLAEWLTEWKEARAELDRLYPILENARILSNAVFEFKEKFEKSKRLLKAAVEAMNSKIGYCSKECKDCAYSPAGSRECEDYGYKWVHTDEALKLIRGEYNDNSK